jgi:hypothetical protein
MRVERRSMETIMRSRERRNERDRNKHTDRQRSKERAACRAMTSRLPRRDDHCGVDASTIPSRARGTQRAQRDLTLS